MPTIHLQGPFRFSFYSREPNEPPHVHVSASGAEAKVWLATMTVARSKGFSARDIAAIIRIVRERRDEFLDVWHGFFGTTAD